MIWAANRPLNVKCCANRNDLINYNNTHFRSFVACLAIFFFFSFFSATQPLYARTRAPEPRPNHSRCTITWIDENCGLCLIHYILAPNNFDQEQQQPDVKAELKLRSNDVNNWVNSFWVCFVRASIVGAERIFGQINRRIWRIRMRLMSNHSTSCSNAMKAFANVCWMRNEDVTMRAAMRKVKPSHYYY